jgi:alpha-beta hydrolase superfamily lysophospholipase
MVLKTRRDLRGSVVAAAGMDHSGGESPAASRATPLVFGGCFGWLHPAGGRRGVVLCSSTGYEALCSHRPWARFAQALVNAGFPTLRFDYPGAGDSSGDEETPNQIQASVAAIRKAVAMLRARGIDDVALVGLRFGAVLAATAAAEMAKAGDPVDAVALLAPPASGAAYVKELRMLSMMAKARRPDAASTLPGIEAAGFYYTPAALAEMKALNPAVTSERLATRVLVLDRADGGGNAFAKGLCDTGADVTEAAFEGYAGLMRDAADTEYPAADFQRVIDWLKPDPSSGEADLHLEASAEIAVPDGIERPVWIEGASPLFGILAEPAHAAADRPVLLILNTGANHHIGTNRMSVLIARRLLQEGIASLRIDCGGIGDSPSVAGRHDRLIARPELIPDVRQAVDWLTQRGYRNITVTGLCAGGWLAYRATLAEPRIRRQILLNVQNLWPGLKSTHTFESNRDYLRLLGSSSTWLRLIRGQIQARAIAGVLMRRLAGTVSMRAKRLFQGSAPGETIASKTVAELASLAGRGVRTEFVFIEGDRGLDEMELHFGHRGRLIGAQVGARLTFIAEGDHLFSLKFSRDHLIELMAARFRENDNTAGARQVVRPAAAMPRRKVSEATSYDH